MSHILTLFDYGKGIIPIQSIFIDDSLNVKFHSFYQAGNGLNIKKIKQEIAVFMKYFGDRLSINDFKAHIMAFGLENRLDYDVYDLCLPQLKITPRDTEHGNKLLLKLANETLSVELQPWHKLHANASVVYGQFEKRGVYNGIRNVPIQYDLHTFTGRSKTLGFNLHGTTDEYNIKPIYDGFGYFIHFDWLAADIRMAAHMSGDKRMIDSFNTSDPYNMIAEFLNDEQYDRAKCKSDFIRAIYALAVDDPIFELFPVFKRWMKHHIKLMRECGYLSSIMGRRFMIKDDNELSVFNSQFQGSVAHAMQAALIKIYDLYPENLFAEIHDSIVMCCREDMIETLLRDVVPIMLNPLDGWVDAPPRMPIKISIGDRWKQWKALRVHR